MSVDASPIPTEVWGFVQTYLESVVELEGLLFLHRSAELECTAEMLALHLYVSAPEAEIVLKALADRGLLAVKQERVPVYRYGPRTANLAHLTDQLSNVYKERLIPLTRLIHSRTRTAAQKFADAFRLKGSP